VEVRDYPQKMLEIVPANVYVFVLFWRRLSILWRGAKYTLSQYFLLCGRRPLAPSPGSTPTAAATIMLKLF